MGWELELWKWEGNSKTKLNLIEEKSNQRQSGVYVVWVLEGGSPMLHIDFKKGQCLLLLFLHVDFKTVQCQFSNLRIGSCRVGNCFLMSIASMFYVEFKKLPCRPVEFKGPWPLVQWE